jgi:hypothetical protein
MSTPTNPYDALVLALTLGITASDEDKAAECVRMAEQIAQNLSELEVKRAQKDAMKACNIA